MPPETLICHRTQLESGCGAGAATGGNRQVHLESVFHSLSQVFRSLFTHPALSLVGQVGQEKERAQEFLPLGLQELHSMSS